MGFTLYHCHFRNHPPLGICTPLAMQCIEVRTERTRAQQPKVDTLTRSSTCSNRHDSIIRGRINRRGTDTIAALKVTLASLMVEKSNHVDNEMDKVMRETVPRAASGHVPRTVPLGLSIQTVPLAMVKSSDSSMSI